MSTSAQDIPSETPTASSPAVRREAGLLGNLRVVSLCVFSSRFLGLARDSAMASLFGAGPVLDAFVVAFRLPNLARQLFGEGALTTAFLPIYVRELERHGTHAARQTLTAVTVAAGLILMLIVGLGEVSIGLAMASVSFSPHVLLFLQLLAILLPYTLLICQAALFCAALNSLRQFLWAGIVPVVLNVVWLAAVLIAMQMDLTAIGQARAVAASVLLAGVLQMAVPLWALKRQGMGLIAEWRPALGRVRRLFVTIVPVIAGLSVTQVSSVVDSLIAWGLAPGEPESAAPLSAWGIPATLESGTASALYIGQRMYQFPLGVFGVALGTVLYPVLTRHAERGELDQLRDDLGRGLRLVIAIMFPASAGLFLLSGSITSVLFRHGAFDAADARLSSAMIAGYGLGVWAFVALLILNRGLFAVGDRVTPVRMGLVALMVNLALNLTLVWTLGGIGLVIGTVAAAIVQLLLTVRRLERRLGKMDWRPITRCLLRTLVATAAMSLVCRAAVSMAPAEGPLWQRVIALALQLAAGLTTYGVCAWAIGLQEVREMLAAVFGFGRLPR